MTAGPPADRAISPRPEGVVVEVAVRPRAGRCRVRGLSGGRVKVEVTAAPEGGEATAQALATLAAALGARASDAVLIRGMRDRHKTVLVKGVTLAAAEAALGLSDP
ncbi:MAG: DUF167 domain-containing protein [Deltaproteobacteria bacterium]|nr:DUF167 domain-containing protein [Deltaproteobacteria bacterium]